jgi:hypothetical protein
LWRRLKPALLENHHAICHNRARSTISRYIYAGATAQRNVTARHYARATRADASRHR